MPMTLLLVAGGKTTTLDGDNDWHAQLVVVALDEDGGVVLTELETTGSCIRTVRGHTVELHWIERHKRA